MVHSRWTSIGSRELQVRCVKILEVWLTVRPAIPYSHVQLSILVFKIDHDSEGLSDAQNSVHWMRLRKRKRRKGKGREEERREK